MIYFVHIKHWNGEGYYQSYDDYFRLVKLSGFAECDLEAVDPFSDNTYIVTLNYHGREQGPIPDTYFPHGRTSKMILHQIERRNLIDERYDEIWFSDMGVYELNHPKAKYVMLGGHKDFMEPIPGIEKVYDFYHMCYLHGRRLQIVGSLVHKGFTFAPCPTVWEQKNILMQQSRAGLALHQHADSLQLIEPLRYTVFSCMKLPIIYEASHDRYPYEAWPYECFKRPEDFNPDGYFSAISPIIDLNWRTIVLDNPFEKCIKQALQ